MNKVNELLSIFDTLSYEEKYVLTHAILRRVYPHKQLGYDVDIVYSCKEKFESWLVQQLEIIADQSKYFQTNNCD